MCWHYNKKELQLLGFQMVPLCLVGLNQPVYCIWLGLWSQRDNSTAIAIRILFQVDTVFEWEQYRRGLQPRNDP